MCADKLEVSFSGKYIVTAMQTGEVNIYSSSQVLSSGLQESLVSEPQPSRKSRANKRDMQTCAQVN